jgi:hypothetical protein
MVGTRPYLSPAPQWHALARTRAGTAAAVAVDRKNIKGAASHGDSALRARARLIISCRFVRLLLLAAACNL